MMMIPTAVLSIWGSGLLSLAILGGGSPPFIDSPPSLLTDPTASFVLVHAFTIGVFAPENYPTRVRGFGMSFILALGTMAGAWMPLVAGKMFEVGGIAGMFSLMAGMYVIFAVAVQFAPETFGRSMEAGTDLGEASLSSQTT